MHTEHIQAPSDFVERYYLSDIEEAHSTESTWAQAWLEEVRGNRILSVGCGPTLYNDTLSFGEIPSQVVGIDFNRHNLEFLTTSLQPALVGARKAVEAQGTVVDLVYGDVRQVRSTFVGQFDTVYAGAILGMLADADLREVLEVLRMYLSPRGKLVDIDWTDCRLSPELYNERSAYGWYSKKGPCIARVGNLLAEAGFVVIRHAVYEVADPKRYGWGKIYGYAASIGQY